MDKKRIPSSHVSIPDETVQEFARQQAATFYAGNMSAYIVSLIEGDRAEGWTHQRILKVVQAALDDQSTEDAA